MVVVVVVVAAAAAAAVVVVFCDLHAQEAAGLFHRNTLSRRPRATRAWEKRCASHAIVVAIEPSWTLHPPTPAQRSQRRRQSKFSYFGKSNWCIYDIGCLQAATISIEM
jgi:hypothetical protein